MNRLDNNWKYCKVRFETAYWLMENEYEAYKLTEEYGFNSKEYRKYCFRTYKISEKDWVKILELFEEEQ